MAETFPSIGVISDQVRVELDLQFRHFDALDSKAGVVLGFSGAIVAISGGRSGVIAVVGLLFAAAAASLALIAFKPRDFPVLDPRVLRDKYLRADSRFTQAFLLDTHVQMSAMASQLLRRKASLVKAAILFLLLSALVLTLDVLFSHIGD